jgi:DNA-binding phage protein
MINASPWDAADHLQTKEAIIAYLEAALEDGDPRLINAALADIARSEGLAKLSPDNNPLDSTNLTQILQRLGLQLQLVDINHDKYSFPTAVDRQPT